MGYPEYVRQSGPTIVCLCGSTRFSEAFRAANLSETLAGRIVLTIGCDFKSDDALGLTEADKARLDELHLRKIDLAHEILVINVDGYIGESTAREAAYAYATGKRVRYLETPLRARSTGGAGGELMVLMLPEGWHVADGWITRDGYVGVVGDGEPELGLLEGPAYTDGAYMLTQFYSEDPADDAGVEDVRFPTAQMAVAAFIAAHEEFVQKTRASHAAQ